MHSVETFRDLQREATEWRRYLHQNPELDYRLHNTARFVAEKLTSFGIKRVETEIAETGIVALIKGDGGDGPTIGLKAEMDALPILEASNKPWSSRISGSTHACGHDGHTAMLLGAAKYLANTRNFKGSVALIFQPAEEGGLGGQRMVQEGIIDRFGISQVFGMHVSPGMEVGKFGICDGATMASLDEFELIVKGRGGHECRPQNTIDPIVVTAQIIMGLQTLVSRKTSPLEPLVVSLTKLSAGQAYNFIPNQVELGGSVRTLVPSLRDFVQEQILAVAEGIASGFGASVEFGYRRHDPVTLNDTEATNLAIKAARNLVGADSVDDKRKPSMGSQDFAYMVETRPGAFIFTGDGSTIGVHDPAYDFNDDALPYGIGYWVSLVETALAV